MTEIYYKLLLAVDIGVYAGVKVDPDQVGGSICSICMYMKL